MTADDELICRLIGFVLSEKEARTYLHLLKYGPKTPSPLAKSLKTYREDIHGILTALIEKGTVHPSLDTSTIYAAVDLDVALGSAVEKAGERTGRDGGTETELHGLAKEQRFRPSDEVATFKALKNIKGLFGFAAPLISSMNQEML